MGGPMGFIGFEWILVCSGGALHGLGWATAHPEKLRP